MASETAPAAVLQGIGTKHAGDDIQERGHDLPIAARITGQQVGTVGLTNLSLLANADRKS